MRILEGREALTPGERPRAVCVGAFDGFHLGHQYLLNRLCAWARERDYESALVTFEPTPAEFFARPDDPPLRLLTREERIHWAQALCCELMAILPFESELASWPAERFIGEILVERLGAKGLVASATHTMGHERADIKRIQEICRAHGIEVVQPPIMQLGGKRINSTAIRRALWEGRVEQAAEMLGRYYSLAGEVVEGRGWGRRLGFPTANIKPPPEKLIPKDGVYAGVAIEETSGEWPRAWPAAISIGTAPTFGLGERLIEAHLLSAEADSAEELELRGHRLRLQFMHYLREQRRFAEVDALRQQIAADVAQTRALCEAWARALAGASARLFCVMP